MNITRKYRPLPPSFHILTDHSRPGGRGMQGFLDRFFLLGCARFDLLCANSCAPHNSITMETFTAAHCITAKIHRNKHIPRREEELGGSPNWPGVGDRGGQRWLFPPPPAVNRITEMNENITFPRTSYVLGKYIC